MFSQERDRVSRQPDTVEVKLTTLTEEIRLTPPERALFKVARFGEAYGKPGTINIHTDYSPEEMMSRFKAVFEKED